jgi:hypothetical protein
MTPSASACGEICDDAHSVAASLAALIKTANATPALGARSSPMPTATVISAEQSTAGLQPFERRRLAKSPTAVSVASFIGVEIFVVMPRHSQPPCQSRKAVCSANGCLLLSYWS